MLATADFRALGTGVRVVSLDPAELDAAVLAVERVLGQVDQACSRFRSDSELSQLNRASGAPTRVSPLLFLALKTALRVGRMTAGAVDPTVGAAMRITGYDRDFDELPADGAFRLTMAPVPGWERIQLDHRSHSVTLPPEVDLDLGSSAKALAADLSADAGVRAGVRGLLVSLGGDISVAGGAPDGGWPILVAEDHAARLDAAGDVISLRTGAIASSSTTVRHWRQGGQPRHHIIDPRTGAPAEIYWRTASVVAASCVDANAAATASIVWGKPAVEWLERYRLAARLVAADGQVSRVNGWPRPAVAA